ACAFTGPVGLTYVQPTSPVAFPAGPLNATGTAVPIATSESTATKTFFITPPFLVRPADRDKPPGRFVWNRSSLAIAGGSVKGGVTNHEQTRFSTRGSAPRNTHTIEHTHTGVFLSLSGSRRPLAGLRHEFFQRDGWPHQPQPDRVPADLHQRNLGELKLI